MEPLPQLTMEPYKKLIFFNSFPIKVCGRCNCKNMDTSRENKLLKVVQKIFYKKIKRENSLKEIEIMTYFRNVIIFLLFAVTS